MSKLFDLLTIKNLSLKNRIVMAPMCMYSCESDGVATPFHQIHYPARALGGVGLIIVEATAVEPIGRISDKDLGLYNDTQRDQLIKIVDNIHFHGSYAGIQLAHAGRKSSIVGNIIAPSAIAFFKDNPIPLEMTIEDIKRVVTLFAEAAKRANDANFDLIEIHCAHGYLINEFISPLSNKRNDIYGKDRFLFLKEIIEAIRKVWPSNKAISIRISADEYHVDGTKIEEYIEFFNSLEKNLISIIDVSTGGVVVAQPPKLQQNYQISHAAIIKDKCPNYIVMGGGLVEDCINANQILEKNLVDLVFIGRPLLANAFWALDASKKLNVNNIFPRQYKLSE